MDQVIYNIPDQPKENEVKTNVDGMISRSPGPSTSMPNSDELTTFSVPTYNPGFDKRKRIRAKFDDSSLSVDTIKAQRKERERLLRLSKQQDQNNAQNMDGISKKVIVLDGIDRSSYEEEKPKIETKSIEQKPQIFCIDPDVIELSSDDEAETNYAPEDCVIPQPLVNMCDRSSTMYRGLNQGEMQRIERERIEIRNPNCDIESKDLFDGCLLANAGKSPDEPAIYIPRHLTDILQPHQLGGIRFMFNNVIESTRGFADSPGFGCILAHAMGLGKTIQVITFTDIFIRATNRKKILILVPINTIQNWYTEYDKWLPNAVSETGEIIRSFNVYLLNDIVKTNGQRADLIRNWDTNGGILLMGYDMFRLLVRVKSGRKVLRKSPTKVGEVVDLEKEEAEANDLIFIRKAILDPGPDLVICDEGHRIKNDKAGITTALNAIKTRRRIVLTGYPLQNNLMEYFCMVDFVRPSYLGTKKQFGSMFEKPIKNGLYYDSTSADIKFARQRTHILVELLKGFVQRRTHHILKNILPPSLEYVVLVRKSAIQRILYRHFLQYAHSEICLSGNMVFNPLKAFAVCSKIWNHPDIFFNTFNERTGSHKCRTKNMDISCTQTDNHVFNENGEVPSIFTEQFYNHGDSQNGNENFVDDMIPPTSTFTAQLPNVDNFMGMSQNYCYQNEAVVDIANSSPHISKQDSIDRLKVPNALLEELNSDRGIDYDWAALALRDYKIGVLENSYKMVISLAIIQESVKIGDKILLYSQSLLTLDIIECFLEKYNAVLPDGTLLHWKRDVNYFRIDGTVIATEREKLINRFNGDDNIRLFLISTRAGCLGINLVSANRVIIFDASWNPCHDSQAVCRVYRYGQKKCTFVYRLIMDNSMEKAIFNRQVGKSGLQQRVVDDRQMDIDVTKRELEQLLVYDEALDVVMEEWDLSKWNINDHVLRTVAQNHSNMFAQAPFLHESLLTEREDKLSEEEKYEAELLYEREKRTYSGFNFDVAPFQSRTYRNTDSGFHFLPSSNHWSMPIPYPSGQVPLRATPTAMTLERIVDNSDQIRSANPSSNSAPENAVQIITDSDLELPCLTTPGRNGKISANERCWLVKLQCGVFIRSNSGNVYDASQTIYNAENSMGRNLKPFVPGEVIDLSDSD